MITVTIVPSLFAVLYTAIAVYMFWRAPGGLLNSFRSRDAVLDAVGRRLHYLAFDLLIGSWELEDSRVRGIPHLMLVPCLLLTFMFGPAGWLLYRIVRSVRRRDSR
jgi:hypothetical protein